MNNTDTLNHIAAAVSFKAHSQSRSTLCTKEKDELNQINVKRAFYNVDLYPMSHYYKQKLGLFGIIIKTKLRVSYWRENDKTYRRCE